MKQKDEKGQKKSNDIKTYPLLIGGKQIMTKDILDVNAPYNNELVGRVCRASEGEIEQALESAEKAFKITSLLPAFERSRICECVRDGICERYDEIVNICSLECGKPVVYTRIEVDRAISTFDLASKYALTLEGEILPADVLKYGNGRITLVRRFPIGVMTAITPFNWPLNLLAHKVAPAMAVGNTVVLRSASQTPLTAHILGEIVTRSGYPPGGLNIVPSSVQVAEKLILDERVKMVSFTGSPAVGWDIKKKAPKKKVTLELGGNAACIVEKDADLDFCVERIAVGGFHYAGQNCISVQRIFVHKTLYKEFIERMLNVVENKIKWGDPMKEETVVGPIINTSEADRVMDWIDEAIAGGAKLLCGGKRHGNVIEPTLLTNTKPQMKVNCFEVFAPLMTIEPFSDFNSVLEAVNMSEFGIHAGIFTRDIAKAFKAYQKLEVGGVMINDYPTFRVDSLPYGGVKNSGFGREGIKYAMEEMTELKHLTINLANYKI